MSETDETVADVLREIDDPANSNVSPMLAYLNGHLDELTYEQWVRPMKLTGGRVCLRIVDRFDRELYVRRSEAGILEAYEHKDEQLVELIFAPGFLMGTIDDAETVGPVRRADTPFGEEASDDS